MKRVALLGASGSIGRQSIEVIESNLDEYSLVKISVGYNIACLEKLLDNFSSIEEVALLDENAYELLKNKYPNVVFYCGDKGIIDMIANDNYDILLNAIVGFAGVLPSIKVIEMGKTIALANKETLVVAGDIVNEMLKKYPKSNIVPVDSEHCAIFQCLDNKKIEDVSRLIISASGGSFRDKSLAELENVSVEQALKHPNWDMGASITIDSATMLNKGLEVIEAHHLFKVDYDQIEVVIHKESIIHSMVEFKDSSTIAQLSLPSMKHPISYALAYPKRSLFETGKLNYQEMFSLNFEPVDYQKFYGLKLAYEAGRLGNSYPCVLNASKEVATKAFIEKKIPFLSIVKYVEIALNNHKVVNNPTIKDLVEVDLNTRKYINCLIEKEK